MTRSIRVLHLEDDPLDAEIIHHMLGADGVDCDIVLAVGKDSFEAALARESFDLILVDYGLQGYDGNSAIRQAQEQQPEAPVIIISGTLGEEAAVKCLHIGATDYLLKQRLERLPAAVRRAVQEAEERLQRKEAEKELSHSEAKFRSLTEGSLAGVSIIQDERFKYVNPALTGITGYSQEEMLAAPSMLDLQVPEGDRPLVRENLRRRQEGEVQHVRFDSRIRRKDGSLVTVEIFGSQILFEGRPAVMSTVLDMSARQRAETDLFETQNRLQLAVSAGKVGLWDRDLRTSKTRFSSEWKHQLGYEDREISEDFDEWKSRVHPDDLNHTFAVAQACVSGARPAFEVEFRLRHKDGSYRHILSRGSTIPGDDGAPIRLVGANVDITEWTTLQAQLRQVQKIETVGQLAGGIAHDFNNLLTVINGTVELAIGQSQEGDPLYEDLQEIRRAGERASTLTRQLLAFSRRQILQPQLLNLNTVVVEMETMLRRLIGEDIDLAVTPTEGLGSVMADPGQMEQVILNLVVNARDAMPQGGQLTIETKNVELDEQYARQRGVIMRPGPYVMLVMSDTGVGMNEVTRERAFEPFFTTKEPGQGTGLGLSTVYGIVKQSGGFTWLYSEVGQGTSVKIYLPQAAEIADDKQRSSVVASPHGTETILVVEDVGGLRHLAKRMLESAGYTVLTAASGEEALLLLERHEALVHLAIIDVVMPGMGGRALAEGLGRTHSRTKVLFTSGYTDDVVVRHGALGAQVPFLNKPFTAADLLRKVRAVLDAA